MFDFKLTRRLSQPQYYGVFKGGEHPRCDILISGGVLTPPAQWLYSFDDGK